MGIQKRKLEREGGRGSPGPTPAFPGAMEQDKGRGGGPSGLSPWKQLSFQEGQIPRASHCAGPTGRRGTSQRAGVRGRAVPGPSPRAALPAPPCTPGSPRGGLESRLAPRASERGSWECGGPLPLWRAELRAVPLIGLCGVDHQ